MVDRKEALGVWARVAALSFGGPAGQIAVMHRILVEEKRWISEERFLHALNYCMLLPGPEAQQLATYIGWLLHRTAGGLVAGLLFILPGFLSILVLSILYASWGELGWVKGLFFGLKAAVLALVAEAVLRIGRRALRSPAAVAIAVLSFISIFFLDVAFPWIVVCSGLTGLLIGRLRPQWLNLGSGGAPLEGEMAPADRALADLRPSARRQLRVALLWAVIWLGPVALLLATLGADNIFSQQATFFSKTALVTFGGAYAALAYVAQEAVENLGWLMPGEMVDGLGMAETTPGPLIQVLQFVGFMGAWRHAQDLPPLLAGVLASILVTWVTFAPCFLWIFVGAPYVERLRGNRAISGALGAVTAAVVGVVLNLGLWLGLHVVFGEVSEHHYGPLRLLVPDLATLDVVALGLTAGSALALLRFHIGMLPTLAGSAALGMLWLWLRA